MNQFNNSQSAIQVQTEYVATASIAQLVTTQLQAGNPPDIIYASPGTGGGVTGLSTATLAKAGDLVNLSNEPWARQYPASIQPLIKEVANTNGKVYSAIMGLSTNAFTYNAGYFSQHNLKLPKTYAQYIALCKTIKSQGNYAAVGSFSSDRTYLQVFAASDVYSKNPNWDQLRTEGKVTFMGTPGWHQVFEQLQEQIQSGCFYPGSQNLSVAAAQQLAAEGIGVIGLGPTSGYYEDRENNPSENLQEAVAPGIRSSQTALSIVPTGLSIAKASHNIPAAETFLTYLVDHRPAFASHTGSFDPGELSTGVLPAVMTPFSHLLKAGHYTLAAGTMWANDAVLQTALNLMQGFYTGQESVDGILKAMDQSWDTGQLES